MNRLLAGLVALFLAAPAAVAQPNLSNMPTKTVFGRLGIGTGPGQAIPFAVLTANLFSGGVIPSGLNLTPSAGTNATGLVVTQAPAGTVTSSGIQGNNVFGWNSFTITGDGTANSASGANNDGLLINYSFGGTGALGGRQGIDVFAALTSASSASNTNKEYVGGRFVGLSAANDGGTNTGGGALGSVFGINPVATLGAAASNFAGVGAIEANVGIATGGSSKYKFGIAVVQSAGDAVQGATYDCAVCLSNQATTPNWNSLFLIGNMNGQFPLVSGGSIMSVTGGGTAANGLDLSGIAFSGAMFKGQATGAGAFAQLINSAGNATLFQVDNAGNIFSKQFQVGGATSGVTTIVAAGTASGALTLPAATDTLVGKATTDTLTNKTFDTAGTGNAFKIAGAAAGTVAQIQGIVSSGQIRLTFPGVNFNSATTDTAITFSLPTGVTRYTITSVRISGASASISTATAGVFTATGGGGQTIAANQAITVTQTAADTNNNTMALTLTNQNTEAYTDTTLQFRIGTAQGSAATADVILVISPLT